MFFRYLTFQAPESEWSAVFQVEQAVTAVLIYGYKDLGLCFDRMSQAELEAWILAELEKWPQAHQVEENLYWDTLLSEVCRHMVRIPPYDGNVDSLERVGLSPDVEVLSACLRDSQAFRDVLDG